MIKSSILAVAALMSSGAIAHPGESTAPVSSERVSYADLDLGSAAGRMALQHRIAFAAERVCDQGGMQTMNDFAQFGRCYRNAVKGGLGQMDQLLAAKRSNSVLAASAVIVTAK